MYLLFFAPTLRKVFCWLSCDMLLKRVEAIVQGVDIFNPCYVLATAIQCSFRYLKLGNIEK